MNSEQLLDAIGKTDESLLRETEQLRLRATDGDTGTVTAATRRPARRKMIIVLAACMVLLLGTAAAYAAGIIGNRGGTVSTGTDNDGNSIMKFEPNEDMRISVSEITGDIQNSTQYMLANWYRLHDPDNYTPGAETANNIILGDNVSGFLSIKFNSVQEALDYIGCERIVPPSFLQNATPVDVSLQIVGADTRYPERPSDPSEVPDFRLSWINLTVGYAIDNITIYLNYYVITEADEVSRAILYTSVENSDPDDPLVYTSETVTENNRDFQVVYSNYNDYAERDQISKEYFWAENKVEYHISFFYFDGLPRAQTADQILNDWMYSFGD